MTDDYCRRLGSAYLAWLSSLPTERYTWIASAEQIQQREDEADQLRERLEAVIAERRGGT